jgi:hypothetical protein
MAKNTGVWADGSSGVTLVVWPIWPASVKCQGCGTQLMPESMAIHVTPRMSPPPQGIRQTFGNRAFCSKKCLLDWLKAAPAETHDGLIAWIESLPIPI